MKTHSEVIGFWFHTLQPKDWYSKNPELDQRIREEFGELHQAAMSGELYPWRVSAHGRLAEVIILDQFSRNMFRDRAEAFAGDVLALILAQEAIASGADRELSPKERAFLYMPFMHSESPVIHARAVELFSAPDLAGNLDYEIKHKAIIDRFGRYPHRNAALGRESTTEELEFLKGPGSSF